MSWPPKCPLLTVDCVIVYPEGIVAIQRKNPPLGLALPGGFVDEGESLEAAVRREVLEEVGVELKELYQIGAYSEPDRDPRQHVVSVAYWAFVKDSSVKPKAGDDAKSYTFIPLRDVDKHEWCFDHRQIISDAYRINRPEVY